MIWAVTYPRSGGPPRNWLLLRTYPAPHLPDPVQGRDHRSALHGEGRRGTACWGQAQSDAAPHGPEPPARGHVVARRDQAQRATGNADARLRALQAPPNEAGGHSDGSPTCAFGLLGI